MPGTGRLAAPDQPGPVNPYARIIVWSTALPSRSVAVARSET